MATILGSIAGQTYAAALAADGTYIVGEADDASTGYAVLWDATNPTAAPTFLGQIAAQTFGYALGVSGTRIVGEADDTTSHAVMWDALSPTSAPTLLGTVASETSSFAQGIDGDHIVGAVSVSGSWFGALWNASSPTSAPTVLGSITNQTGAQAYAIHGDRIVGYAAASTDIVFQGALWDRTSPTAAPARLGASGVDIGDFAYAVYGDYIGGQGVASSATEAPFWDAANPTAAPVLLPRIGSGAQVQGIYGTTIVGADNDNGFGVGQATAWSATSPTSPSVPYADIANQDGASANAISASGLVVGNADDNITFTTVAVLWASGPTNPNVAVTIAGNPIPTLFQIGSGQQSLISIEVTAPGVASATLTIVDQGNSITISDNDSVVITDPTTPGHNAFKGNVQRRKIDVVANYRIWTVTCADLNTWLDQIIVGAPDGTQFLEDPPGTFTPYDPLAVSLATDSATIQALFANYAGFLGIDTTTFVETIGPLAGKPIRWNAVTLRSALNDIAGLINQPALRYWIDQDAKFHWTISVAAVPPAGSAPGPLVRMFPVGSTTGVWLYDDFARSVSPGWASATIGGAWIITRTGGTSGAGFVNGSSGVLDLTTAFGSGIMDAVNASSVASLANTTVAVVVRAGSDNSDGWQFDLTYGNVGNMGATGGALDVRSAPASNLVVTIFDNTGSVAFVTLGPSSGYKDVPLNVVLQIDASMNVSAKIYKVGDPDPGWQVTAAATDWGPGPFNFGFNWTADQTGALRSFYVDSVNAYVPTPSGSPLILTDSAASNGLTIFNYDGLSVEYDDGGWADLIYVNGATTYSETRTYIVEYIGGGLYQTWTGTDNVFGKVKTLTSLTVRSSYSDSSSSLGSLASGAIAISTGYNASGGSYTYSGTHTDWYEINFHGDTGWIHAHGSTPYQNSGLVNGMLFTCEGLQQVRQIPAVAAVDEWKQLWRTGTVPHPNGIRYDPDDPDYIYVVDGASKRISRVSKASRLAVSSVYIGKSIPYPYGISGDPGDSSVYWVINTPWSVGGSGGNFLAKINKSTNAIIKTYALPAGRWTDVKVSAAYIWLTNLDTDKLHKYNKSTGASIASYSISYGGVTQVNPTGLYVDGTTLGVFFLPYQRFLRVDESAPTTVVSVQSTAGYSILGGEIDTTTHRNLYSNTSSLVLNFELRTTGTAAHDINYYVVSQPGSPFDKYWIPALTYRASLSDTVYAQETGGSGWADDLSPATTTVAQPRQRLLTSNVSDTQGVRDSIGAIAIQQSTTPVVRGQCAVTVAFGGWAPGLIITVVSVPAALNGDFMVQKAKTEFLSGVGDRKITLDWGTAPVGTIGLRRGAQIPPGTIPRRPAQKMYVYASNHAPGAGGVIRVFAQAQDMSGNPWPIAGKTVTWSFRAYDTDENEVTAVLTVTFSPTTSTTNIKGEAWTDVTLDTADATTYYFSASLDAS